MTPAPIAERARSSLQAKRKYLPWTEPLWRKLGLARRCYQGCEHYVRRQYHICIGAVACVATLAMLGAGAWCYFAPRSIERG